MRTNDKPRTDLSVELAQALRDNDASKVAELWEQRCIEIGDEIRADYENQMAEVRASETAAILAQRGVRQLTGEEREFYQAFGEAIKSRDWKQAISNLDKILPESVVNSVFDELRENHPLLNKIRFTPTNAQIKLLVNTNGAQKAVWGELCSEIEEELATGFAVINTGLLKLSAFLPVCKAALELGPEWLDRYVREVMYEAYANGLEDGIINGDGDDAPIGMIRQYGEGTTVTDGVYPEKSPISVSDFGIATVGNLIARVARNNGKNRAVSNLILIVNPADYYSIVAPATMVMGPDGTYHNTMPYPIDIIQSAFVEDGRAVFGLANRYFAAVGSPKEGRITYSDEYKFLEDQRVYVVRGFANGQPLDGSAFLYLNIEDVVPAAYCVVAVDERTPSSDATLTSLKIGSKTLSPAFDPEEDTYTASTTDATNTISVQTADANAVAVIMNGSTVVKNGEAATWAAGSNTLQVIVTAEDGTTTETYTVTVTKS